jgi:hypothetical protein
MLGEDAGCGWRHCRPNHRSQEQIIARTAFRGADKLNGGVQPAPTADRAAYKLSPTSPLSHTPIECSSLPIANVTLESQMRTLDGGCLRFGVAFAFLRLSLFALGCAAGSSTNPVRCAGCLCLEHTAIAAANSDWTLVLIPNDS